MSRVLPYPQYPSNAIGNFQIGTSPIGTIPPFDWLQTVVSQYANSAALTQLLANFFEYLDQTTNFDNFFDCVWNILTAQGWGLDVWGRIVGVSRTLQVSAGDYLGFEEADDPSMTPFGQAPFYAGEPATSNYALSDDAYRTLILAKALANICDGSARAINQLLLNLFPGRGNAYVTDGGEVSTFFGFAEGSPSSAGFGQAPFYSGGGTFASAPMTMTYVFKFQLTPVERAIVEQSGVLPTPAGVAASIVINP